MFIVLFFAAVAISLALFDAVLNRQYRHHVDSWRQDGCPWGFFSFPPREVGFLAGCQARNSVFARWLLRNPVWSAHDGTAVGYLWLFRLTGALSLVFWTLTVLAMLKLV